MKRTEKDMKAVFLTTLDGLSIEGIIDLPPVISGINSYNIGLCKMEKSEDSLVVHVRRPGLLISKAGENIRTTIEKCSFDIIVREHQY